jgi:hypothetical protein
MKNPERSEPPERRDNDGLHRRRGVWYYCLAVNGRRKFFSTKTRAYQAARKVRADAIKAQQAGQLPNDFSKWPFEKLLLYVREQRAPSLSENTIRIERERSGPLLKHFASTRVSTIGAASIRAYQTARAKDASSRTVNLECKLLRFVLKAAKVWAAIAEDYKSLRKTAAGRAARSPKVRSDSCSIPPDRGPDGTLHFMPRCARPTPRCDQSSSKAYAWLMSI